MKTSGGPRNSLFMRAIITLALLLQPVLALQAQQASSYLLLQPESFLHYFTGFERDEKEMLGEAPPLPWDWFAQNIPLLDVPDKELEEIYYFRWYAFQKHIVYTPDGFVISEFLDNVPWAGKFNTIDAASGHQLREARWLRNSAYAEDYAKYWFGPDGEPRRYSFWAADSVYQVYLSTGDKQMAVGLLPALEENYRAWESTHQDSNGLFWQIDDRDGMEFTIGGSGYRPTINSYMYGDAEAISRIAEMAGHAQTSAEFRAKAEDLRKLIDDRLWNAHDDFYETVPRNAASGSSDVRELVGYVPWYFDIPPAKNDVAWKFLFDPQGFAGRYGPTTVERRSPRFRYAVQHECLWNGPAWPFATTQTLVAMANVLNGPEQSQVNSSDYYRLLSTYTHSQHIQLPDGRSIPWIDEDLDADTGEWIARNILISLNQPPKNRGRYYNHSGFADLVITGLLGLRPTSGNEVLIHPLVPPATWDYFALDGVPYHGHLLTILYDRGGNRYHRGAGLQVYCDGRIVAHSATLQPLSALLPSDIKPQISPIYPGSTSSKTLSH
jgi:hypothetical protein